MDYVPGEGNTYLFGGNSNWRGPIWFPINYLIVDALERYDHYYGNAIELECYHGLDLAFAMVGSMRPTWAAH